MPLCLSLQDLRGGDAGVCAAGCKTCPAVRKDAQNGEARYLSDAGVQLEKSTEIVKNGYRHGWFFVNIYTKYELLNRLRFDNVIVRNSWG